MVVGCRREQYLQIGADTPLAHAGEYARGRYTEGQRPGPEQTPARNLARKPGAATQLIDGNLALHPIGEQRREVIDQIRADARQVVQHGNTDRLQVLGRADPRHLQKLRRVYGAAADDHLASRLRLHDLAAAFILDAGGTAILQQNAPRQSIRLDTQIGAAFRGTQKGTRGRMADAPIPAHLGIAHAFRFGGVEIGRERDAGLLRGFHETMSERQDRAIILDRHFAVAAAIGVVATDPPFRFGEKRQDIRVAPAGTSHLRPAVVIGRMTAQIQHAVDRTRPAEHLAARPCQRAIADARLGLAGVVPVEDGVAEQLHHAGRDMDHGIAVARSCFEQQYLMAVFAQTRRDHASGRSRADDDKVSFARLHEMKIATIGRSGFPVGATVCQDRRSLTGSKRRGRAPVQHQRAPCPVTRKVRSRSATILTLLIGRTRPPPCRD